MNHYFRRFSASQDPTQLLDPDDQVSTPWGSSDHGPCEKCSGAGRVRYRCLSCLEREEPDTGCPSCAGRVTYQDVCPSCEGTGSVSRTERHGVSVFPTERGLYRYLLEREVELGDDDVVLELAGKRSDDLDLDADEGALLVLPTEIIDRRPSDRDVVDEISARLRA